MTVACGQSRRSGHGARWQVRKNVIIKRRPCHGSSQVTRFSDLHDFIAIPAVTSLRLAPDGSWLAATVQAPGSDPKKKTSSIWRVDTGQAAAVRLTRSADGESSPEFAPDGSLLFISKRTEQAAPGQNGSVPGEAGSDRPALWLLPAGGGEAIRIAAPPGGAAKLAVARLAGSYLLAAPALPGTVGMAADAARRKARRDAGVSAILHESGQIRYWDHDLGPDCLRLLAGPPAGQLAGPADAGEAGELRDLTPDPGRALDEQSFAVSPDGSMAVSGWLVSLAGGEKHTELVVIDVATSRRRTLLAAADADFSEPVIAPDGRQVVATRSEHDSYQRPGDVTLVVAALDGDHDGPGRDLLPGFDRYPLEVAWAPDCGSVYFTADDNGRCPVFRVDLATGDVAKITTDDGAYNNLCPAPDGQALYALRATISEPPAPVRIDLTDPAAGQVALPGPVDPVQVPGHVEEITATAADGAVIRAWLVLPDGAGPKTPAPLLLWVHGGPVMSWNSWSWRWNPWLMAARGYAVLMPDPALSTGYGQDFIARGHGSWGGNPYRDVMAITDVAVALPQIDASRTAMMGGSFGGYMANWIAGHTDRFAAIVSHASLWALDQMLGTTDDPLHWRRTFGDPVAQPARYLENSPHLHVDAIATPMLIIHGDKDYRVPIGEALRLYTDLASRGKTAKFLYFPDENHWILKPGDIQVWYETIFAFLAEHVLSEKWQRPELL
jgi:dipeptidyl aminopeptidase/acylaminoacyl peptidase